MRTHSIDADGSYRARRLSFSSDQGLLNHHEPMLTALMFQESSRQSLLHPAEGLLTLKFRTTHQSGGI
jgi:hypothetical protein